MPPKKSSNTSGSTSSKPSAQEKAVNTQAINMLKTNASLLLKMGSSTGAQVMNVLQKSK